MTIQVLESNQARNNWREMLDAVLIDDVDVVITRYNKPLVTVVAFEDYLAIQEELNRQRAKRKARRQLRSEALATVIASEQVLAREWDSPEEDEAWAAL